MEALLALLLAIPNNPRTLTIHFTETAHAQELDAQTLWIQKLGNECESMGSTTVRVLDTNGKYSYGFLQFQMATWLGYGKQFGATKENIYDAELQKKVARYMLDNPKETGGWKNWYNCTTQKIGPYPTAERAD